MVSQPLPDGTERLLIVQCGLEWMRPSQLRLRQTVDDFLLACHRTRPELRIDRLLLHNLPTVQAARGGDLHHLAAAHVAWLSCLAASLLLLPDAGRIRVHRLIVAGDQAAPPVPDGVHAQRNGAWQGRKVARPVLELIATQGRTTPLTASEVNLDGPFGDADPSVYL